MFSNNSFLFIFIFWPSLVRTIDATTATTRKEIEEEEGK
jgi:hypothetical protein